MDVACSWLASTYPVVKVTSALEAVAPLAITPMDDLLLLFLKIAWWKKYSGKQHIAT
jgi:hypothetical protein